MTSAGWVLIDCTNTNDACKNATIVAGPTSGSLYSYISCIGSTNCLSECRNSVFCIIDCELATTC